MIRNSTWFRWKQPAGRVELGGLTARDTKPLVGGSRTPSLNLRVTDAKRPSRPKAESRARSIPSRDRKHPAVQVGSSWDYPVNMRFL